MAADLLWPDRPLPRGVTQVTGRAMGSDLHLLLVGGPTDLAARGRDRIEQLERRWSRFRPDSELSVLSTHSGRWVPVSADTWQLVATMVAAWEWSEGRCDATVLPAVTAAGYDRDLALLPADRPADELPIPPVGPTPGLGAVSLAADGRQVRVPPGVRLDPGAIGKGLAADLVSAELIAAGARGVLVNVGGDIAVAGEPVDADAWRVELVLEAGEPLTWVLARGAIATSSSRRRRWRVDGRERHHLIDPSSGRPVSRPPATVSVLADRAWRAEAAATATAVGGAAWADRWAPAHAITGLLELEDGSRHLLPGAERFLA